MNGKLVCECLLASFVLRLSDLSPHLPLVFWVLFLSGPVTAQFDGVSLTGCYFSTDMQITGGKLVLA